MHSLKIVHRDLKFFFIFRPANIFLNEGNAIIGDFGLSTDKPFKLD
jgi:hypothetical protein